VGFGWGVEMGLGMGRRNVALVIHGTDRWQNLTLTLPLCFEFSICGGSCKLINKVGRKINKERIEPLTELEIL